jgi:RNA polymerase sigma-70 factor (ECF subfamily)
MRNKGTETNIDREIVRLFTERDQKAIELVSDRYGSYLLSVCENVLGSREDSEECLNDAYMRAWNSIPPNRPDNLKAYMARLARAAAIDRYRYLKRDKRGGTEVPEPIDELAEVLSGGRTTEEEAEADELAAAFDRFLEALPDRERVCFMKRYYFSEPVPRIAAELGVPVSTMYGTLSTILKKLRGSLEKEGFV